ncbi:MAG: hypothetical protein FGM14_09900 [Flavobacteriales bacterium]|nr:hypothetical protein [Flavobacteriales bacterium]
MKQLSLFLITLVFLSCKSSNLQNHSKKVKEISNQPTDLFLNFTFYLDSVGFICDVARAQSIESDLNHSKIIHLNNKPFFVLIPKKHEIQRTKQFLKILKVVDTLVVDFKIFLKPIFIFAYYYRQKKESNFIEDGIIEEWHFNSKSDALKAFTEINKIKEFVYVNTYSFILIDENKLYIFHTRASAFKNTLQKIHQAFNERLK